MPAATDRPSPQDLLLALRGVVDPELGDDIVSLGMVRSCEIDPSGLATIEVALTIASCPLRDQIRNDVTSKVKALPGVSGVEVVVGAMGQEERSALMARARWKAREAAPTTRVHPTTRAIAIASGKGGVGKSTLTANLAAAIAAAGAKVGVLDADIAGFSIPRLLGATERLVAHAGAIDPLRVHVGQGELHVVSMGMIEGAGEDQAVMLRGLMLNRALQHFLEDVRWPELDYLLIDMPPGTGDVQMGLARMLPRADVLVVTTPAIAAQQVASRSVDMARKGYLRVAGVIENMSGFVCEHGDLHDVFGSGGGERLAAAAGVPLLGKVPLDGRLVSCSDAGTPVVLAAPNSPAAAQIVEIARRITDDVVPKVEMAGCTSRLLRAAAAALDDRPHTA